MILKVHRVFEVYWEGYSWQGFRPDYEFVKTFETENEAKNFIKELEEQDKENKIAILKLLLFSFSVIPPYRL